MKIKGKNPALRGLIEALNTKSIEEDNMFWKSVSLALNRPNRKQFKINLYRLDRSIKPNETVVIPGTVLGGGEIAKPATIAAYKFSAEAKKKIEKAKGRAISIEQLMVLKPDGSGARIIG
jgi:large subunit ribosomal protein L18e